jgi:uncharacterized protein with HEPN domain
MSFEPRDYLRHILAEADYLIGKSQGLTFENFDADETLRRAFMRSLEVIGEAVKKLPAEFREQDPEVEWGPIARLRDRLIHGHIGIDYQLVWDPARVGHRSEQDPATTPQDQPYHGLAGITIGCWRACRLSRSVSWPSGWSMAKLPRSRSA